MALWLPSTNLEALDKFSSGSVLKEDSNTFTGLWEKASVFPAGAAASEPEAAPL